MLRRHSELRVRVEVFHTGLLFKHGRCQTCAVMGLSHRMAAMPLLVTARKALQIKDFFKNIQNRLKLYMQLWFHDRTHNSMTYWEDTQTAN